MVGNGMCVGRKGAVGVARGDEDRDSQAVRSKTAKTQPHKMRWGGSRKEKLINLRVIAPAQVLEAAGLWRPQLSSWFMLIEN